MDGEGRSSHSKYVTYDANALSAMLDIVRPYAIQVRNNAGVSNADKTALGLTIVDQTKTTVPPPTSSPLLNVLAATQGEHTIRYADSNARVAQASLDMFLAWFPGLPKRLGAYAITALMDDRLREALGFPRPPRPVVRAVEGALRARARAVGVLPARRRPKLRTRLRRRSYRNGWRLDALGPMPPDAA